jgi:LPXTG-motif cell wall-anchored protein
MLIILALLLLAGATYLLFRRKKRSTPPHETYVCDVCNERDCICSKQGEEP